MPFQLTHCILWTDNQGVNYCIKKYVQENGAFYCTQEVVAAVEDCEKLAPSGAVYKNKGVTRWYSGYEML